MALFLRTAYDSYNWIFNEFKDDRVEDYKFLVPSPVSILGCIFLYVQFVNVWGPKFMENRKPFELNTIIKLYNFVQILVNFYMGVYGTYVAYILAGMSFTCQPLCPEDNSPGMQKMLFITYMYYLNKVTDLLDTIFFVLRKKQNQVTFLHVYHHGGMVFATYVTLKLFAGSHATFMGLLNAIVHTSMYTYYFLTTFRPELRQSIWWKKYITQIQLVQFVIFVAYFSMSLVLPDCRFPRFLSLMGLIQNSFMFILFYDFYRKTYVSRKSKTPPIN